MEITLKAARVNADLSMRQAAGKLGVAVSTLKNWEDGKTFPSTRYVKKIEETYNCTYADIRFGKV